MMIIGESGGNTNLYTLVVTWLLRRESEVNEENTKVGNPNYSSIDHSKRPIYLTNDVDPNVNLISN